MFCIIKSPYQYLCRNIRGSLHLPTPWNGCSQFLCNNGWWQWHLQLIRPVWRCLYPCASTKCCLLRLRTYWIHVRGKNLCWFLHLRCLRVLRWKILSMFLWMKYIFCDIETNSKSSLVKQLLYKLFLTVEENEQWKNNQTKSGILLIFGIYGIIETLCQLFDTEQISWHDLTFFSCFWVRIDTAVKTNEKWWSFISQNKLSYQI